MKLQTLFPVAADDEANQQDTTSEAGEAAAVADSAGLSRVLEHLQASKLNQPLINGYGWLALWERIKARGLAVDVALEASMFQMPSCSVAMPWLAREYYGQL